MSSLTVSSVEHGNNLSLIVNSIESLSINSSGFVTKPETPFFYAWGGPWSGTLRSNVTYVAYNSVLSGSSSSYNSSNGRFTAPVSGKYLFLAEVLNYPTSINYGELYFAKNGSTTGGSGTPNNNIFGFGRAPVSSQECYQTSNIVPMNQNDYIHVAVRNMYLYNSSGHGFFCGIFLG